MAGVAPAARLVRDPEGQRALRGRSLEATARLHRGAAWVDEASARQALDAELEGLRAALWQAPAYREALVAAGASPNDLQTLDDLAHLPLLDRPTLAATWDRRVVRDLVADDAMVRSSGSTGDPVVVPKDRYDTLHMWAVIRFWAERQGLEWDRPRVALLDALPGGLEYEAEVPIFAEGHMKRISTRQPDPEGRLRDWAPQVLSSDPAGLHWFVDHPVCAPDLILTGAQHFSSAQRQAVGSVSDAPVVDYYALTEIGPVAWACLEDPSVFHVLTPDVWVESVDGELVVTRLRESLFPMVRYRTGDAGEVAFRACSCGVTGWSITGLRGRRFCGFVLPSGAEVDAWSLAWVFKGFPLERFRLTQLGPSRFQLDLAGRLTDPGPLVERLAGAMSALGWVEPEISVSVGEDVVVRGPKPEPFRRA